MSEEPKDLVLQILREMRADIARLDAKIDAKIDETKAELRSEMRSLRADVASDLMTFQAKNEADNARTRKELGEQIAGLRRAVMEYHSSTIGHGALISELDARVRRIEQHLDLGNGR
jgi:formate-dependent nitrite reductase cytochrome c552 subunit